MITLDIWNEVLAFAQSTDRQFPAAGIMICGSIARNEYRLGSDIDILFLSDSTPFCMETIPRGKLLFDRMVSPAATLGAILTQVSPLSNVLSLSFGSAQIMLRDSDELRALVGLSRSNMARRNLSYSRWSFDKIHRSGQSFTVEERGGLLRLMSDDQVIV